MAQGKRTNSTLAFIELFLPMVAGPSGTALAALVPLARKAFQKSGGGPVAEFDAVIARVDKKIARLADPDSFTRNPIGKKDTP